MDTQSFWFLENIDVTGIFCPKKLGDSPKSHTYKIYKKGEYIYLPNDHSDKIYFINEGRIKIRSLGEGNKEITKILLGKGEVFGELALIGQEKRRDFAQAMEETNVCILSINEITSQRP